MFQEISLLEYPGRPSNMSVIFLQEQNIVSWKSVCSRRLPWKTGARTRPRVLSFGRKVMIMIMTIITIIVIFFIFVVIIILMTIVMIIFIVIMFETVIDMIQIMIIIISSLS